MSGKRAVVIESVLDVTAGSTDVREYAMKFGIGHLESADGRLYSKSVIGTESFDHIAFETESRELVGGDWHSSPFPGCMGVGG